MSSLHNKIIEVLYELCMEHKSDAGKKRYSKIYTQHIGLETKSVILTARSHKKPEAIYYYPDVWVKVKNSPDVQIYEVWHSEKRSEAVEDILFSSFVEGITYLHIVCTGAGLTDIQAKELVNIILNKVRDEKGELRLKPNQVLIADIPQEIHDDISLIKNHLAEKLKFNL